MLTTTHAATCDGCGSEVDPDVQPRVILYDANEVEGLHFCAYACVARWAEYRHEAHERVRATHLAVTIEQIDATLLRAHQLEHRVVGDPADEPLPGEYSTVASVPLHPLVELTRTADGTPHVVARAAP